MNKQELLDKAVHEFGGKWVSPKKRLVYCDDLGFIYSDERMMHAHSWFISEFQQRAKELGYVNGYRWGVEYPTNGKKPDLEGDVFVDIRIHEAGALSGNDHVCKWDWIGTVSFRITDQRYKPADTSYLDSPAANKAKSLLEILNDLSEIELAAVRDSDEAKKLIAYLEGIDHNRKAEAEKKRVVDAAAKKFHASIMPDYSGQPFLDGLGALYDAGYLKLPTE